MRDRELLAIMAAIIYSRGMLPGGKAVRRIGGRQ